MKEIDDLFVNKLSGETLTAEEEHLWRLREQYPQHRQAWEEWKEMKRLARAVVNAEETDREVSWQRIEDRIGRRYNLKRYLRYVGVVLIPVLISVFALHFFNGGSADSDMTSSLFTEVDVPLLRLSDGNSLPLVPGKNDRIRSNDGAIFTLSDSVLDYSVRSEISPEVREKELYHTLYVPNGAKYRLKLADGTRIWINSGTEIRYPTENSGDTRHIHLSGEAFFEVAKDSLRPFIVSSGMINAKVLGTVFNVSTYVGEVCNVTLVSGSLQVNSRIDETQQFILRPGENARQDQSLSIQRNVDLEEYIGWRYNQLNFVNQSLEGMMTRLARWYDFQVEYTEEYIRDYSFSARFDQDESLEEIVRQLEQTNRIRIEIKDKKLVISDVSRK